MIRTLTANLFVFEKFRQFFFKLSKRQHQSEIFIRSALTVYLCKTGLKLGINYEPPCAVKNSDSAEVNRGACMLLNTSAITGKFAVIDHKFDLLYAKRSFVHWFVAHGKAN